MGSKGYGNVSVIIFWEIGNGIAELFLPLSSVKYNDARSFVILETSIVKVR